MNGKARRTVAVFQVVGGALLLASSATESIKQVEALTPLALVLYPAIFAYAGLVLYYGLRLWTNAPSSYIPSAILWTLQIPAVISGPVSYNMVTGFGFIARCIKTSAAINLGFEAVVVERHVLYLNGQVNGFLVGINLFAALCALALWYYGGRPDPARESGAAESSDI